MKNITLSADERLIEKARERARREHRSLNDAFRSWLEEWAQERDRAARFDSLMERLEGQCEAGRHFSRDELNER
ncbi:MAG: hypothetical protein KA419_01175 [Acidobacteria bacterium]|nr:hypothetical protein [Acidobacteriota bacterium]